MFQLRPYQEMIVEGNLLEFDKGLRRILDQAPCGAGKTVLWAYMASQARLRGNRTLFVVHRQELIDQSAATLREAGVPFGVIAAGYPANYNELIQIGSIQTLTRRLDKMPAPIIIFPDECHHAAAATWRKLLAAYPDAFVIGFTATPARMGGQGLGDIFQSLILGPTVKELISWGNLAPFKYFAPPVAADFSGLRVKMGDYVQSDVTLAMDKSEIIGDLIEHYKKLAPGARAVCYCASVAHSQHTAEMFRQAGINALHIDGETHDLVRKAAINDFKTGAIKILCNVDLISEGFDVPAMEAVILARPTQSLTLHIQQSMRPMRPDSDNPGKVAVIIDHVGNVYRHGLPDEDREWSLEGVKKKSTGPKQEFPLRQCDKCYAAHRPAPVCPICGYVYPVEDRAEPEQKAGQLSEVLDVERRQKKIEVGKAKDVVTLEQIAMQRGYSPHWCRRMCEVKGIKFGFN
ncbi:MAG: DEAD/DEAH box helicase [Negativicutes bacterium]|nr:DEAD/DEAH box helicase [Negativicutes bacterium]